MKADNPFGPVPAERADDQDNRSMCAVGIMVAAAVCSVFWFAVGYLVGKVFSC